MGYYRALSGVVKNADIWEDWETGRQIRPGPVSLNKASTYTPGFNDLELDYCFL